MADQRSTVSEWHHIDKKSDNPELWEAVETKLEEKSSWHNLTGIVRKFGNERNLYVRWEMFYDTKYKRDGQFTFTYDSQQHIDNLGVLQKLEVRQAHDVLTQLLF